MEEAAQRIKRGNLREAAVILRDFIEANEQSVRGHYLMGAALSGLGQLEESDKYLRQALNLDEGFHPTLRFLGLNAFQRGKLEEAERYLQRFLEHAPDNDAAHLLLGQIALAREDFAEAVDHLGYSTRLIEGNASLQLVLARALSGDGQIVEAKEVIHRIDSVDGKILFEVGLLLASVGSCEEAIERFNGARPHYPDTASLSFNLALCHFELGNYEKTVSIIQEELVPQKQADAGVYNLLADAHRRMGRAQKAYNSLQMAVFLSPQEKRHYVDLLALCIETRQIEPGLEIANLALKQHPSSYEIHVERAILHSLTSNLKPAESDYRRALELAPDDEWLYPSLALVLMFDDRLEEARVFLEEHLDRFENYYTYYLYAEVVNRLGLDRSESLRTKVQSLLERSIHLNPAFSLARVRLGNIYATVEDWSKAIPQFQAAIAIDPGDKTPYYELSLIYRRMGNLEKTKEMLTVVRRLNQEERRKTDEERIADRLQALQKVVSQSPR